MRAQFVLCPVATPTPDQTSPEMVLGTTVELCVVTTSNKASNSLPWLVVGVTGAGFDLVKTFYLVFEILLRIDDSRIGFGNLEVRSSK